MSVTLQRLWIQLTADRKRFAVLCASLAVGLLLWARLIVVSNVPRTAVADKDGPRLSALDAGHQHGVPEEGVERWGEHRSAPAMRVTLDESPMRDPFVISAMHFPHPPSETQSRVPGADQSKSASHPAEDSEVAKARRLAVLAGLASRFRLEAVMNVEGEGGTPMAVIGGRTRRLGEEIPAVGNEEITFELLEVRHRSVLLRVQEHIFEVKMDR